MTSLAGNDNNVRIECLHIENSDNNTDTIIVVIIYYTACVDSYII